MHGYIGSLKAYIEAFLPRNRTERTRNPVFLPRNVADRTRNVSFPARNGTDRTRNASFPARNSTDRTRNASFPARNGIAPIDYILVSHISNKKAIPIKSGWP